MNAKQEWPRPQAVEWIALAVGLVLVLRYRWLLDDAFVYFRYLDNLLFLDLGLVFNQGEYVEGFSSPAWLLLLLPLRALGLDYWYTVQALGCITFVAFWYGLVTLNRRLSPAGAVINLPLLFLAGNYAALTYFTSGLETPLVQLMAVLYALYILAPSSRALEAAMALSPLVRHEFAVPLILVGAWSWYRNKRFPTRLKTLAVIFVGGWVFFRVYYYADLFPNTFYLKNLWSYQQGLVYLHQTLTSYHFYSIAVVIAAGFVFLRQRGDEGLAASERLVMLAVATSVAAYVVSIGGDPRHYRFLAFPLCLVVCSFAGLIERLIQPLLRRGRRAVVPVGVALLLVFSLAYPPQLDAHPVTLKENHQRVRKISDASYHRHMRRLQHRRWSRKANRERMRAYAADQSTFRYEGVGKGFWCVRIYQRFDWRMIHSLGLTDAFLARTEMESKRTAHKWGLTRLAGDIVAVYRSTGQPGRGTFRWAVERNQAPEWIGVNLDTIEIIEKKVFNRHSFWENLSLALTFPDKIDPRKGGDEHSRQER